MAKFQKKPVEVEAITFDELVQHGREVGGNIVNGMPWSFDDMLIIGIAGEIYPCKRDIFEASYDAVSGG